MAVFSILIDLAYHRKFYKAYSHSHYLERLMAAQVESDEGVSVILVSTDSENEMDRLYSV